MHNINYEKLAMATVGFNKLRWISFVLAIVMPLMAWSQMYQWRISSLTQYQIFPLFGMWAVLVIASHFILAGLKTRYKNIEPNQAYSDTTGTFVLICILIHPILLAWVLWKNSLGLPPKSYYSFVGSDLATYIVLGSVALFGFLAYEILQNFRSKPTVIKYWVYIYGSQLIALLAIFIHAYGLGAITQTGWFKFVWVLVGFAALIGGIVSVNYERKKHSKAKHTPQ